MLNCFFLLYQVALWGNKCDLSISAGTENSQLGDPLEQLESYNKFILVNNTQEVWDTLQHAKAKHSSSTRLSIVLDNAGSFFFMI